MKKRDIFIGLSVAIVLAIFSFLASVSPDGLERVAEDKNFITAATNLIKSPMPDYILPCVRNERISGSLAGILGVFLVFFLGWGAAKLLERNK